MRMNKECVKFYEEIIKPLVDEIQENSRKRVISYSMDRKLMNDGHYDSLKYHKGMERILRWYIESEYHINEKYSCNIRIHRGVGMIVYNDNISNSLNDDIAYVEISCSNNSIKESIFFLNKKHKINKHNLK